MTAIVCPLYPICILHVIYCMARVSDQVTGASQQSNHFIVIFRCHKAIDLSMLYPSHATSLTHTTPDTGFNASADFDAISHNLREEESFRKYTVEESISADSYWPGRFFETQLGLK
jgi:hypothetical protein